MKYLDNNGLSYLMQKIKSWLNGKVDKVSGKTLTTNDFTNAYKTAVDTNSTARHSHSNKTVLDGITSEKITEWDNKLSDVDFAEEVFVWDGKSSSTNSANLALFQKIYDTWRTTGKAIVIATMSDGERVLFSRLSVLSNKFYLVGNYAELSISGTNKWGYQYTREVKATIGSNNTITSVPALTTDYDTCQLQAKLVSGTNIKTINNQSILGSGDLDISSIYGFWEDISDVDTEIVTYASDITFSYKKMYRIANKFIYFVCAGVKASAATAITIGNIKELYRPPLTTYIGGCGPESKPITVSASINGDIIARLTSNGTWFGFSIMWAIKDPNE